MNQFFNKTFLISFLVNGGVFALIMAIFDYTKNKPFDIWQFLFYFFFFGLFMALVFVWKRKKDSSK